jgi:hypothetical protein
MKISQIYTRILNKFIEKKKKFFFRFKTHFSQNFAKF